MTVELYKPGKKPALKIAVVDSISLEGAVTIWHVDENGDRIHPIITITAGGSLVRYKMMAKTPFTVDGKNRILDITDV